MCSEEQSGETQRWAAKRKVTVVLSILKGETTVVEAARKRGLTVADIEEWKDRFLSSAENGLRAKPKNDEAHKDEEIKQLKQKQVS